MKVTSIIVCILLISNFPALADISGKISGQLKDADTGEVLPAANIVISAVWWGETEVDLEAKLGAASDAEGFYYILNVKPGMYSVTARYMGYQTAIQKKVLVRPGLTTTANFNLKQEAFAGQEVVVVAERPVIDNAVTSTEHYLSNEEVANLPAARISDVLEAMPNVYAGRVRGGLSDETGIVIDGSQKDPGWTRRSRERLRFAGESNPNTHDQFIENGVGGFQIMFPATRSSRHITGLSRDLVQLSNNVFSQVALKSGPLSARYGGPSTNFMVYETLNPSSQHQIAINLRRTAQPKNHFGPNVYQKFYADSTHRQSIIGPNGVWMADSGAVFDPNKRGVSTTGPYHYHYDQNGITENSIIGDVTITGPITRKIGYLYSARYDEDWGPYPNQQTRRLDQLFKLRYDISPQIRLTGHIISADDGYDIGLKNGNQQGNTTYYYTEKYNLQGMNAVGQRYRSLQLQLNHTLSPATFYKLQVERGTVQFRSGMLNSSDRFIRALSAYDWYNLMRARHVGDLYTVDGLSYQWLSRAIRTTLFSGEFYSQLNKHHLLQFGGELSLHEFDVNATYAFQSSNVIEDVYLYPKEISLWAEDKIEYSSIILNIGCRFDWFDPGAKTFENPYAIAGGPDTVFSNIVQNYEMSEDNLQFRYLGIGAWMDHSRRVKPKWAISPRIGVAHPIKENITMYYAVGRFFQRPPYEAMFMNYSQGGNNGKFVGNPDLDMIETTKFEMRLNWEIFDKHLFSLSGFYSETHGWVGDRSTETASTIGRGPIPITIDGIRFPNGGKWPSDHGFYYLNGFYNDVRGLEIMFQRTPANRQLFGFDLDLSGMFSYFYSFSKLGRDDNLIDLQVLSQLRPDISPNDVLFKYSDLSQPFDSRNQAKLILNLDVFNRINISTISQWREGVLYTPLSVQGYSQEELVRYNLFKRGPAITSTEMRVRIKMFSNRFMSLGWYLDVNNLFNKKNIIRIISVPHYEGVEGFEQYKGLPDDPELMRSERVYGPAREIWSGLSINFKL